MWRSSANDVSTTTRDVGIGGDDRRVASTPSTPGHRQVHEHDVGGCSATTLDGLAPSAAVPTSSMSSAVASSCSSPRAHHGVVVGDHDADRRERHLHVQRRPVTGLGRTSSGPPASVTRPRSASEAEVAAVAPGGQRRRVESPAVVDDIEHRPWPVVATATHADAAPAWRACSAAPPARRGTAAGRPRSGERIPQLVGSSCASRPSIASAGEQIGRAPTSSALLPKSGG